LQRLISSIVLTLKKPVTWVLLLITIICFNHIIKDRWHGNDGKAWMSCIASDGYGYYAYLPYTFIYHKVALDSDIMAIQKFHPGIPKGALYEWISMVDDKGIDKYFVGVSILQAPFFLIAYAISLITGHPINGGYTRLFEYSISIAALFYVLLGLFFLYKLLKVYGLSETSVAITLFVVLFGTNLYDSATMSPYMSHAYSFGMTAIFLYYIKKSIDNTSLRFLIPAIISLSLLVIIRPPNLLSIWCIPFLAGSYKNTKAFLLKVLQWKILLRLILAGLVILSLQLYSWYAQTGHLFLWSYTGERFDFLHPHICDFLFSFKKGWLLYTPVMVVFIAGGFIYFFKENKFRLFSFILFLTLVIFVLSSWQGWWYGSSFGQRPIIDFYPNFALFFCIWFNAIKSGWLKAPVLLLLTLFLALNLIQTYQYDNHIITGDNMDKRKYNKAFLHTGDQYQWIFDDPDKSVSDYIFAGKDSIFNNYENGLWGGAKNVTSAYSHSGHYSAFADSIYPYSPCFSYSVSLFPKIPNGKKTTLYINIWVYMPSLNNAACLVVSLEEKGKKQYFWSGTNLWPRIENLNEWEHLDFFIDLPPVKNNDDILRVYLYNTSSIVYMDDETIKFGTEK
jgi:hypothetical protein